MAGKFEIVSLVSSGNLRLLEGFRTEQVLEVLSQRVQEAEVQQEGTTRAVSIGRLSILPGVSDVKVYKGILRWITGLLVSSTEASDGRRGKETEAGGKRKREDEGKSPKKRRRPRQGTSEEEEGQNKHDPVSRSILREKGLWRLFQTVITRLYESADARVAENESEKRLTVLASGEGVIQTSVGSSILSAITEALKSQDEEIRLYGLNLFRSLFGGSLLELTPREHSKEPTLKAKAGVRRYHFVPQCTIYRPTLDIMHAFAQSLLSAYLLSPSTLQPSPLELTVLHNVLSVYLVLQRDQTNDKKQFAAASQLLLPFACLRRWLTSGPATWSSGDGEQSTHGAMESLEGLGFNYAPGLVRDILGLLDGITYEALFSDKVIQGFQATYKRYESSIRSLNQPEDGQGQEDEPQEHDDGADEGKEKQGTKENKRGIRKSFTKSFQAGFFDFIQEQVSSLSLQSPPPDSSKSNLEMRGQVESQLFRLDSFLWYLPQLVEGFSRSYKKGLDRQAGVDSYLGLKQERHKQNVIGQDYMFTFELCSLLNEELRRVSIQLSRLKTLPKAEAAKQAEVLVDLCKSYLKGIDALVAALGHYSIYHPAKDNTAGHQIHSFTGLAADLIQETSTRQRSVLVLSSPSSTGQCLFTEELSLLKSLVGIDHRVLESNQSLTKVFKILGKAEMEIGSDPTSSALEFLVFLVKTYSDLRQLDFFLSTLLGTIEDENIDFLHRLVSSTNFEKELTRSFFHCPPGQYKALWELIVASLSKALSGIEAEQHGVEGSVRSLSLPSAIFGCFVSGLSLPRSLAHSFQKLSSAFRAEKLQPTLNAIVLSELPKKKRARKAKLALVGELFKLVFWLQELLFKASLTPVGARFIAGDGVCDVEVTGSDLRQDPIEEDSRQREGVTLWRFVEEKFPQLLDGTLENEDTGLVRVLSDLSIQRLRAIRAEKAKNLANIRKNDSLVAEGRALTIFVLGCVWPRSSLQSNGSRGKNGESGALANGQDRKQGSCLQELENLEVLADFMELEDGVKVWLWLTNTVKVHTLVTTKIAMPHCRVLLDSSFYEIRIMRDSLTPFLEKELPSLQGKAFAIETADKAKGRHGDHPIVYSALDKEGKLLFSKDSAGLRVIIREREGLERLCSVLELVCALPLGFLSQGQVHHLAPLIYKLEALFGKALLTALENNASHSSAELHVLLEGWKLARLLLCLLREEMKEARSGPLDNSGLLTMIHNTIEIMTRLKGKAADAKDVADGHKETLLALSVRLFSSLLVSEKPSDGEGSSVAESSAIATSDLWQRFFLEISALPLEGGRRELGHLMLADILAVFCRSGWEELALSTRSSRKDRKKRTCRERFPGSSAANFAIAAAKHNLSSLPSAPSLSLEFGERAMLEYQLRVLELAALGEDTHTYKEDKNLSKNGLHYLRSLLSELQTISSNLLGFSDTAGDTCGWRRPRKTLSHLFITLAKLTFLAVSSENSPLAALGELEVYRSLWRSMYECLVTILHEERETGSLETELLESLVTSCTVLLRFGTKAHLEFVTNMALYGCEIREGCKEEIARTIPTSVDASLGQLQLLDILGAHLVAVDSGGGGGDKAKALQGCAGVLIRRLGTTIQRLLSLVLVQDSSGSSTVQLCRVLESAYRSHGSILRLSSQKVRHSDVISSFEACQPLVALSARCSKQQASGWPPIELVSVSFFGAFQVLHALQKSAPTSLSSLVPQFMAIARAMLQLILCFSDRPAAATERRKRKDERKSEVGNVPQDELERKASTVASWASYLSRLLEATRPQAMVFRKYVTFFLAEYIQGVGNLKVGFSQRVRRELLPGIFSLFDICKKPELQQLHSVVDSSGKILLKDLLKEYDESHKYGGKV